MVIKLLQQSTFRRYAAIVLSPFFLFLLISMCNCAVNWCDKLRFLHLLYDIGETYNDRRASQYLILSLTYFSTLVIKHATKEK